MATYHLARVSRLMAEGEPDIESVFFDTPMMFDDV